MEKTCDVLIIGHGMAGGTLARQLHREFPQLKICVLEKKQVFDYWVGESVTEVFEDYAIRLLGLNRYLHSQQISKYGFRFWFDNAEKNLRIEQMSEHGPASYTPAFRGYQIDRKRFDTDLVELNRADGIEVLMNTRVLGRAGEDSVKIDGKEGHVVNTSIGPIRCKYLIDAGGRQSPLARQFELVDETSSPRGSYWGRFENIVDLDDVGDEAYRRRVNYTRRWSSTNHFMYDDCWFWVIPIDQKTTSIGVTFEHAKKKLSIKNGDELVEFFRSYKCLDELLGKKAKIIDFMGLKHIERGAKQFFSEDRWFLTGMSGLFVDPIFSASSVIFTGMNRFITEIIRADLEGDEKKFKNRIRHGNITFKNVFMAFKELVSDYRRFGCFDAFVNLTTVNYHTFWNHDVANEMADFKPVFAKIDSHDEHCSCGVGKYFGGPRMRRAAIPLADEFVAFLDARGLYYARNAGWFYENSEPSKLRERVYDDASRKMFGEEQEAQDRLNWETYIRYYVTRMCEIEGVKFHETAFRKAVNLDPGAGQTLKEVFDAVRNAREPDMGGDPKIVRWSPKGPIDQHLLDTDPSWCRFEKWGT